MFSFSNACPPWSNGYNTPQLDCGMANAATLGAISHADGSGRLAFTRLGPIHMGARRHVYAYERLRFPTRLQVGASAGVVWCGSFRWRGHRRLSGLALP